MMSPQVLIAQTVYMIPVGKWGSQLAAPLNREYDHLAAMAS